MGKASSYLADSEHQTQPSSSTGYLGHVSKTRAAASISLAGTTVPLLLPVPPLWGKPPSWSEPFANEGQHWVQRV